METFTSQKLTFVWVFFLSFDISDFFPISNSEEKDGKKTILSTTKLPSFLITIIFSVFFRWRSFCVCYQPISPDHPSVSFLFFLRYILFLSFFFFLIFGHTLCVVEECGEEYISKDPHLYTAMHKAVMRDTDIRLRDREKQKRPTKHERQLLVFILVRFLFFYQEKKRNVVCVHTSKYNVY